MRRLVILLLALAVAGVVFGATLARAERYGCHEISLGSKAKNKRTVCYPCMPSTILPSTTPSAVKTLWDQMVCPAPDGQ